MNLPRQPNRFRENGAFHSFVFFTPHPARHSGQNVSMTSSHKAIACSKAILFSIRKKERKKRFYKKKKNAVRKLYVFVNMNLNKQVSRPLWKFVYIIAYFDALYLQRK